MKPMMRGLNAAVALCLGALLASCATSQRIGSADDIQDDGKRNTVMLSYELQADSFDRLNGENKTTLSLRCAGEGALSSNRACFALELPFAGQQIAEGAAVNRFELAGARPFLMKYGDYRIDSADFKVTIGRTPQVDCYTDKRGRTDCRTTYKEVYETHSVLLPRPIDFRITPGSGCYLGDLTLSIRGDRIAGYSLESDIEQAPFENLPPALRLRAREFVDRPCA